MRKAIPLTSTVTDVGVVSPEHARFLASLNRAIERTLASGKIKIRPHGERQAAPMPTESTADGRPVDGAFVRRDRGSTGPISEQAVTVIQDMRDQLNRISDPAATAKAPPPRRAPPARPAFKRPTALTK